MPQLHLLQLHLQPLDILGQIIILVQEIGVLLDNQVVFDLEILCSSKTESGAGELVLESGEVVLEALALTEVEVDVGLGRGLGGEAVDLVLD